MSHKSRHSDVASQATRGSNRSFSSTASARKTIALKELDLEVMLGEAEDQAKLEKINLDYEEARRDLAIKYKDQNMQLEAEESIRQLVHKIQDRKRHLDVKRKQYELQIDQLNLELDSKL